MTDKTPLEKGFLEPEEALQAIRDGKYTVNEIADAEQAGVIGNVFNDAVIKGEIASLLLKVDRQQLTGFFPKDLIPKDLVETLKEVAETYRKIEPFVRMLRESYPKEEAFWHQPFSVIYAPIDIFAYDRQIEDASGEDIAARKEDFLAFFAAYLAELEAANALNREPTDEALSEILSRILLEDMREKGFLGRIGEDVLDVYDRKIVREKVTEAAELVRTIYPLTLAGPIDKVSKLAFAGSLTDQLQSLAMERKGSRRQVTTLASINFSAPQLQGIKGLTHYDEAVYTAVCSLYDVGNEYMTPQMIFQAMRGNNEARISPEQAALIRESITKFMYGGAYIDATQEAERHRINGGLIYDSNLLHAERVTHNLNGTITECIHVLKTPVLFEYARSKNQIGRAPIAALATPVDKNEETFALQAYLLERIFAMRGTDPQRNIAYSSVYSAVLGEEAASSKGPQSGYIRVKKSRIRKKIAIILGHWTTSGTDKDGGSLIRGFTEYPTGGKGAAQGIKISL